MTQIKLPPGKPGRFSFRLRPHLNIKQPVADTLISAISKHEGGTAVGVAAICMN
jgi:hypothetical protein